jgi:replicative DNA helicase
LLVVDYLQLMQGHANRGGRKFQNENDELTAVSRGLKVLAKDLAVPVVVCSNLSRASEARDDRRPQLSDLRGSGSIEQDADVVILIHRPDMYPPKKSALRRKTSDIVNEEIERGVAELIVAKNRGGRMAIGKDVIKVLFRKEFTKFENLAL